jgi:hypothetical protein
MPTLSDARRWLKDQFSHDEQISGSPKPIIREAEKRLDKMNSDERTRTITHLKAYADLYYQGRHNENVPTEVQTKFQEMQQRIDRLNSVDKARQVVQQYGGPPTKQTVLDSLSRTYQQRVKDYHLSRSGPIPGHANTTIAEQFQQGYKQRINMLNMEFNSARSRSNDPEAKLATKIFTAHSTLIRQGYETNSDPKLSTSNYFNYGQRAALKDWYAAHENHSEQSQSTAANSPQQHKTDTAQHVSQQTAQSNSQANSNSTDQPQKFTQVQRDYGMSY